MTNVMDFYEQLMDHFGPRNWWPAGSPFEVIVGAILTQQANWRNVEKAIANLKAADVLDPDKIVRMTAEELEGLIRPSGFYRQKGRYLKTFCKYLVDVYGGDVDSMFSKDLEELRPELLGLDGIGPETCDSILLYAGEKLTFVVDAYTVRVCQRAGLIDSEKYDDIKSFFEKNTTPDILVYNEYHALFVELGKRYCRTSNPGCEECPVSGLCNHASKY